MSEVPDKSAKDQYIETLLRERAEIEASKKALIEEFTKSIPDEWSPDDLKVKVRDLLASAYARIAQTIDNQEEPALAFQASKFVFQIGMGQLKIKDDNDPDKEFLTLLKDLAPKNSEQQNKIDAALKSEGPSNNGDSEATTNQ